jgi:hypothetical protein
MRRLNPSSTLRTLASVLRNDAGGMIPFIGAAVPVVAILLVGASELAMVGADKAKLQDVADAVAMDAAQELAFTVDEGVVERTKSSAAAHLAALRDARPQGAIEVTPTIQYNAKGDPEGMHVAIKATRQSFFGNMLPPGGFVTQVETTALRMGKAPLCVLVHSSTYAKTLNVVDLAKLSSSKCLIHSNKDIAVEGSGALTGQAVEAVSSASGNITPTALTGAESIADPFATMQFPEPSTGCITTGSLLKFNNGGVNYLEPGLHCASKIEVSNSASGLPTTLIVKPGYHYFRGSLVQAKDSSILKGDDVVLVFNSKAKINFNDQAKVELGGRRSTLYAGFVLVGLRDNSNDFVMWSDYVDKLLGVVYIPSAQLIVQGSHKMAEQSDWTVVVARNIQLKGAADLVINANYRGSPVPVPQGVGNKAKDKTKNARLKR